jgi:general L-amino acid transport system substrate-binding protein
MWTRLIVSTIVLIAGFFAAPSSNAGETLSGVKARKVVRCGVSEGIPGFSARNKAGRWVGLEADFCRAVAAAVLEDGEKVKFVPLKASERFPALLAGAVDLLARNTTCTLGREAGLKVMFPGTLFFDGQAFMVPSSSRVREIRDLDGAIICVEKGTTHQQNLADYFVAHGLRYRPSLSTRKKVGVFSPDAAAHTVRSSACRDPSCPGGPRTSSFFLPEI